MNKILLLLIIFFSISEIIHGHLTKNEMEKRNESQILKQQNSQVARNLMEVKKEVSYVLQITGLKQIGIFIYGMGMRLVGMQNLLVWQIVHLYQQSQIELSELYFNIGDYINGYMNPDFFTFQGFGYGYLFQKLNLMWQVGIVLFCIGVLGRFILAPWFKYKALRELEKRVDHKNQMKQTKVQGIQQHNITQENFIKEQIFSHCKSKNFQLMGEIENQINESENHQKSPFQKQQNILSPKLKSQKKKFPHPDSSIKPKIVAFSSLQTCDGSNLRKISSNIKKTQSMLVNQVVQENISQIEMKNSQNLRNQQKFLSSKVLKKNPVIEQNQDFQSEQLNIKENPSNKQIMKHNYRNFKLIQRYSNVLLKQIVFNILINSITISSYGALRQIMYPCVSQNSHSLSYSGVFILITQVLMLLITFGLVLRRQVGAGQNRDKFKITSYGNAIYWSISILQRLIYGSVLATRCKYSIVIVASLKLTIIILSKLINIWRASSHYYRYLCQNFIHLLIYLILILDQFYLRSTNNKFDVSKVSIAWVLLSLLSISFLINFYFIVKESGLIRWVKNFTGFSSSKDIDQTKNVNAQTPNILNQQIEQNMTQNQSDSTKRVKFKVHQQIIPATLSKRTQRSIPNYQIQRQVSQKRQQNKIQQKKQRTSILPSKSQSMIKSKTNHSQKLKPYKIYAKTHKHIENEIDDAQRARKSQHVVIQQIKQQESYDQDEAQIVSIQLNNQRQGNSKNQGL